MLCAKSCARHVMYTTLFNLHAKKKKRKEKTYMLTEFSDVPILWMRKQSHREVN